MTHCALPAALLLACLTLSLGTAVAADRFDHFKGLPADSLEEAVRNFSEYNTRLSAVLEKDALSAEDLATVHELTYTLENALDRISADLAELAELLEEVHVASETGGFEATLDKGREYLETARTLVP